MTRLVCGITGKTLREYESWQKSMAKLDASRLIRDGYNVYVTSDGQVIYGIREWGRENKKGSDWNMFINWKAKGSEVSE